MFEITRLKLTTWYLLIIMLISIFFSFAIYKVSISELERIVYRAEFRQMNPDMPVPYRPDFPERPHRPTIEDLNDSKEELIIRLLLINGIIFFLAGGAGYFLAGRTLKPIKKMIEEQDSFISNASHELRTPIATLRAEMEASLMQKNISDKQARDLISSNLEELDSLQLLTNNLLLLAQANTVVKNKNLSNISLLDAIKTAEKKVNPLAKIKNITINTKTKDYLVKGEFVSLTEVFVSLLDNSIKYSKKNKTITISTKASSKNVMIKITDQGMGIPAEDLPHVFERFYRADKSRSTSTGYGLGLSITKKVIEEFEGTIRIESKENIGTAFIITLPRIIST